MGRILAIDYGLKRTGVAATDPLQIIASPVDTIPTEEIVSWLKDYTSKEEVETIVVGMPTKLDGSETHTTNPVLKFVESLKAEIAIPVILEDERFTSKMAQQSMIMSGMKKKERRKKENVDKISASIILHSYLEKRG